ncbi:MAG: WG repeat-containing protein [Oscillospiraceae bacterium]|nr:WG repeat-containing protein [Oscillospiraceae bacterium]
MKKRICLALALLLLFCSLPISAVATEMTYEVVISPQYEEVGRFNEGYAPVKIDGKWGYINESNELVVEPKYDWAGIVSEGVAVTLIWDNCEDEFGEEALGYYAHLIDMEGMDKPLHLRDDYPLVIGDFFSEFFWGYPNCKASNFFANASLWFCNDGIVNVGGISFTSTGERVVVQNKDDYGMRYCDFNQTGPSVNGIIPIQVTEVPTPMCDAMQIDKDGNVLFYSNEYSRISAPWEGVQMACKRIIIEGDDSSLEENEEYLWGLMDTDYTWLTEPQFINYMYTLDGALFHDGLMPVQFETGRWGAINMSGELVIDAQYDAMSCFNRGFSCVKKDGKCFFIDTAGQTYTIQSLDGNEANIALSSKVSNEGLAAVYDADTGKAYYVDLLTKHDGVIPAVTGSDTLGLESYVDSFNEDGSPESMAIPSSIVPIKEGNLWGFAKLTSTDSNTPFTDVPSGSWFEAPVLWALENGITSGTSDTTFSPGNQCLRAHVVTFLWNAEKTPEPAAASSSFSDVPAGAWYEKPVLWALENGITSGVSPTKFGAGDVCSRYQVVFFLWKAAGSPEPKTTVNPFTDVNPGHFFYKAVLWAVENGITSGTSDTTFSPAQPCNRAQVVTFLYAAYN